MFCRVARFCHSRDTKKLAACTVLSAATTAVTCGKNRREEFIYELIWKSLKVGRCFAPRPRKPRVICIRRVLLLRSNGEKRTQTFREQRLVIGHELRASLGVVGTRLLWGIHLSIQVIQISIIGAGYLLAITGTREALVFNGDVK